MSTPAKWDVEEPKGSVVESPKAPEVQSKPAEEPAPKAEATVEIPQIRVKLNPDYELAEDADGTATVSVANYEDVVLSTSPVSLDAPHAELVLSSPAAVVAD